jgi:DNA-binding NarL/FixJ family response regulator
MQTTGVRVLIVDDHEPWRRQISSVLAKSSEWQIVGEAADGVEAVEQAEALRPDLILLDVELPRANGLDAARRILAHDAEQRILFLTAHRSWDIAEAALATGARGYVLKAGAGFELLPAMDAIVQQRRFVSAVLGGRPHGGNGEQPRRHEAVCCSDAVRLLDEYARFAGMALESGKSFIVASSPSRRSGLDERLSANGVDLDAAVAEGRYIWLDVPEMLASFMVDGFPDQQRFWKAAPGLIMSAARGSRSRVPGVAACGDGAGQLWAEGRIEAAIRVEQLWDELARTYNVDILCGYPLAMEPHEVGVHPVQCICDAHTAVHSR